MGKDESRVRLNSSGHGQTEARTKARLESVPDHHEGPSEAAGVRDRLCSFRVGLQSFISPAEERNVGAPSACGALSLPPDPPHASPLTPLRGLDKGVKHGARNRPTCAALEAVEPRISEQHRFIFVPCFEPSATSLHFSDPYLLVKSVWQATS